MAVVHDADATTVSATNATTSLSNAGLTIGAGTNRVLIATLAFGSNATIAGLVVKWDAAGANQSLTQIVTVTSGAEANRVELWGLVNPVSGNKTLSASWTNPVDAYLDGTSFTGADQTGGTTTFAHATSDQNASSSPITLTITSAVGNQTISIMGTVTGGVTAPNKTQVYYDESLNALGSGAEYANGAATVTHQWTNGAGGDWTIAGCDIVAATGGGSGNDGLMWLYS